MDVSGIAVRDKRGKVKPAELDQHMSVEPSFPPFKRKVEVTRSLFFISLCSSQEDIDCCVSSSGLLTCNYTISGTELNFDLYI